MFCKTIILSNTNNANNNAPKGILTLSNQSNTIIGKIRLYNISTLPQSANIGLYIDEKVYSSKLVQSKNCYTFDLDENIDISKNIYCAIIDVKDNKRVLLEGGSFNGFYFTDSPFDAVLEDKDEELEQVIENSLIEQNACPSCDCSNCEYKKYFYENHTDDKFKQRNCDDKKDGNCETYFNPPIPSKTSCQMQDEIQSNIVDKLEQDFINSVLNPVSNFDTILNDVDVNNLGSSKPNQQENKSITCSNQEKLDFLNEIIYQLDELIQQNPEDEILNNIIPNSKFVKIENESPYVLGLIYEDNVLKYIAYGVPATYNQLPPKDLGEHYQWLPINPRDVMSDGYFMIFQDALTGTLVEINFEE